MFKKSKEPAQRQIDLDKSVFGANDTGHRLASFWGPCQGKVAIDLAKLKHSSSSVNMA